MVLLITFITQPSSSSLLPRSRLFPVCTTTKIGARKLPKLHTKRQPKLAIWSLMIGPISISCCNFLTSLILTTREITVGYKWITCLTKAFPDFSPLSFSSCYLYKAYVLLIVSLLALPSFSCVHLCSNKYALLLTMTLFQHSRF